MLIVGYYCKFVEGFSSTATSLKDLTKKKAKVEWTDACDKSLQELKDRLTSAPVLTLPLSGDNYTMYCDTSRVCLGCILMKGNNMISKVSRQLKVHEKNYPIMLGV